MAKLTKKQYVRKRLFVGLAVFLITALITTGLAVWLLLSGSGTNGGGNIQVGQVANSPMEFKNLKLNNEAIQDGVTSNVNFVFDSADGDDTGRVTWNGQTKENLTVKVQGMLLNAQFLKDMVFTLQLPTGVIEAGKKGYIDISEYYDYETQMAKEIPVSYTAADIVTASDGLYSVLNFSFEVKLKWGEAFDGINPSLYYDTVYKNEDGSIDKTKGLYVPEIEVVSTLQDLYDCIKGGEAKDPVYNIVIMARVN